MVCFAKWIASASLLAAAELVDGGAHLPVTVAAGALQRGDDVGTFEIRQGHDGPAPHGGLIIERAQDRRSRSVVAESAQRSDGGLATTCILVVGRDADQLVDGGREEVFPQGEDGAVDDEGIGVIQGGEYEGEERVADLGVRDERERLAPHVDLGVVERATPLIILGDATTGGRAQRQHSPSGEGAAQVFDDEASTGFVVPVARSEEKIVDVVR